MELLDVVKQYHEQTKHDFNRYARALGYMDWANQPDPFRRYNGAPLHDLPLLEAGDDPVSPPYESLFSSPPSPVQPLTMNSLSRFFEYSLSITAWKEYGGNRWALRSNPSSGNLHPTEGYLLIRETAELPLKPGLYHYAPKEHGLEHRWHGSTEVINALLQPFPAQSFFVGLSSIHWREAWKYGERAFRYCQHDVGHALGTLRIAGAVLGWRVFLLAGLNDQTIGTLLGLNRLQEFDRAEPEFPELLCVVCPVPNALPPLAPPYKGGEQSAAIPIFLDQAIAKHWEEGDWRGKANRLSRDNPVPWEIIDDVTKASWKTATEQTQWAATVGVPYKSVPVPERERAERPLPPEPRPSTVSAHRIIHQRRSAVAFDGKTSISARQFFTMLERVMPHPDRPVTQRPMPWDSLPWDPTIHLALFVHRVDGLLPGMYMLLRNDAPALKATFQQAMHEQFVWTLPNQCPASLPLYLLEDGNAQRIAIQVSCHQEIAGDGAFSLGMIAEFETSLEKHGPWFYKRLFWETGLIGQVLYLEAEAAGVRSTGIGCFFDDPVHRVLGWHPDAQFQSLYHFTVGGAVDDPRLTTLPPYGELRKSQERVEPR
ncbi:MAG: SagB/ThcOx family dehydrogenase [Nitrospira sp. SB0677_bin_15]|nr:SagB/ThcOx family dehydrogenase [Nitrospira sp. SB0667_bin_9]MYD31937.1 SagB/ThcOx family dehydrogenase [Nitrospira sp. SB0661_bin_20]MYG39468.1 SagB/ThcOx family dehydrogenase [Nitrospira sp. SB0677_bin_15]MYH01827.1 SagB/ThcOx family dehydrogenase [Nitrospira sp. SB0675_bin_23]MYJ22135.1 SagB/ThcOx family dehydrogenase [Nitrospira sp. SB0673_bin_12]